MKLRKSPRTWRWRRRIAQDRPRRAARTYTSTSSRKSFRVGRSGWRLGRGVSRPLSSRFMKGDGIPLTPVSGPLLPPRKDLVAGLLDRVTERQRTVRQFVRIQRRALGDQLACRHVVLGVVDGFHGQQFPTLQIADAEAARSWIAP